MADYIKNIVIQRLEEDNQFHIYFPQTLVDGFVGDDAEAIAEHFGNADVHVTPEERANVFNKAIVLDEHGLIPGSSLTRAKRMVVKDFANFRALIAEVISGNVAAGEYVMVLDSSDKPSGGHEGWEIVLVGSNGPEDFKTINTAQLIDYAVTAAKLKDGYTSTSEQIDQMVAQDHTHANLAVLNRLDDETVNKFAKKQDMTAVKYGENATTLENAEGDIVFNVTGVINE